MRLRDRIAALPKVGPDLVRAGVSAQRMVDRTPIRHLRERRFSGSADYWERRYTRGHTSGVGSRGEIAQYKADFLNQFVGQRGVESVIEFGCGDGYQLALARYPRYIGVDVSPTVLRTCVDAFNDDDTKSFFPYATGGFSDRLGLLDSDLSMSIDVVFHLVEDDVYDRYMRDLFGAAKRFVIIFSPDGSLPGGLESAPHVRGREFTSWVEEHAPDWRLAHVEPNPFVGEGELRTVAEFHVFELSDAAG